MHSTNINWISDLGLRKYVKDILHVKTHKVLSSVLSLNPFFKIHVNRLPFASRDQMINFLNESNFSVFQENALHIKQCMECF